LPSGSGIFTWRTGPLRVRLDEERGVLVDTPEDFFPGAQVRGRLKNREYQ
jgi:hypothetical protein